MRGYIVGAIRREPDGMFGPDLCRQAFEAAADAVYASAADGRSGACTRRISPIRLSEGRPAPGAMSPTLVPGGITA